MKKILATKMLSEEVVKYASSLGFELSMMDVIKTQCVAFDINSNSIEGIDAIIFTSDNAVNCFFNDEKNKGLIIGKTIISTSGRTAETLTEKGFTPSVTGKNAADISEKIISSKNIKSVLHICGNLTLDTLRADLMVEGIKYKPLVVYHTLPLENKKPEEKFDAIMFFSPSGVKSYLKYNTIENEAPCCIGSTTADAFTKITKSDKVVTSLNPTPFSMLKTLAFLFHLRHTTNDLRP